MNGGASSLSGFDRLALGASVAGGRETVSGVSRQYDVSRKCVRGMRDGARRIMEEALRRDASPVAVLDSPFVERFVVAAALVCNCPFRGIVELMDAAFGFSVSLGTVHNICANAIARAKALNGTETLEAVRNAAIDEIFQGSTPVFAGVDLRTLYAFILREQPDRSGASWWLALEQCRELGLSPESVIGDGGLGLRKGMAECFPDVPCDGDVFHALRDITQVLGYVEKKALGAMGKVEEVLARRAKAAGVRRNGFSRRLGNARQRETALTDCHDRLETIYQFMREEVLDFNELAFEDRRGLFDWLVAEMRNIEGVHGRIPSLRKKLERERDALLAVFGRLDGALAALAGKHGIDMADARMMVNVFNGRRRELRVEMALADACGKYGDEHVQEFLDGLWELTEASFRASSPVENLNSVLRTYFQQRREIGHDYLELLRFYLNHRVVDRSRVKERKGKSPYELLTGKSHAHWLDMLGFTLGKAA